MWVKMSQHLINLALLIHSFNISHPFGPLIILKAAALLPLRPLVVFKATTLLPSHPLLCREGVKPSRQVREALMEFLDTLFNFGAVATVG